MYSHDMLRGCNDGKVTLLVVDDEPGIVSLLKYVFRNQGFRILCACDGKSALEISKVESIACTILDYSLPDTTGDQLFHQLREIDPALRVLILTAHPELEIAIKLMKEGVCDYLTKPFDPDELIARVLHIIQTAPRQNGQSSPTRDITRLQNRSDKYVISDAEVMQAAQGHIQNLQKYPDTTVLITGPTGTGKTAVARRIHELTHGKNAPFVEIDCSTIPRELCESELFGHEKGSFTGAHCVKTGLFETAKNGTAFLDEIGELEPALQAKFLRVLESRQFKRVGGHTIIPMSARIIAATNRSLPDLVRQGQFREDLFFRLNVFELWMPPLKDRKNDISSLARHFLNQFVERYRKQVSGLDEKALEFLNNYDFPGNVRELRNMIERAVINTESSLISVEHLVSSRGVRTIFSAVDPEIPVQTVLPLPGQDAPVSSSLNLAGLEKEKLLEALAETNGNKSKAAKMVGLSRTAFHRRLQKYHIVDPSTIPAPASTRSTVQPASNHEIFSHGI